MLGKVKLMIRDVVSEAVNVQCRAHKINGHTMLLDRTVKIVYIDYIMDCYFPGCKNFLKLCKIKYYNFCLFHSIQVCEKKLP